MSCANIENELVGFHFGELAAETRSAVEAHLPGCPACLASYLLLKRQVETADGQRAPSEASRARLRAAVVTELGLGPTPWRWWERPLAVVFASLAVMLSVMAVQAVSHGKSGYVPPAIIRAR